PAANGERVTPGGLVKSDDEQEDEEEEHQGEEVTNENMLEGLASETEIIDLTHARLRTLEGLGLERFKGLKILGLRQNLLKKIEYLEHNTDLEEVDFYDNAISRIGGLDALVKLKSLDLSFNKIKHIDNVSHLKDLTDIFFVANKISVIDGLSALTNLTNLELGANRLRVGKNFLSYTYGLKTIENLDGLVNLKQLWLGKNKITQLQGFDNLPNLVVLSIQSNRIRKLENLTPLVKLEELYISHNGITVLEGLEGCKNLRVLDISSNRVEKVENLDPCPDLEELWASSNAIATLESGCIEAQLNAKVKPKLNTLYLEGNPLQVASGTTYRLKVQMMCTQLTQLDATPIKRDRGMTPPKDVK
ncbi:hypothetical protein HK101_002528, partial [Irineochytrium annulatum]